MSEYKGEISDGYHTFNELYEHRYALYFRLIMETDYPLFIFKDHYDSTCCDCITLELSSGQISYHVPRYITDLIINSRRVYQIGNPWDGHSSSDVIERLKNLLN